MPFSYTFISTLLALNLNVFDTSHCVIGLFENLWEQSNYRTQHLNLYPKGMMEMKFDLTRVAPCGIEYQNAD